VQRTGTGHGTTDEREQQQHQPKWGQQREQRQQESRRERHRSETDRKNRNDRNREEPSGKPPATSAAERSATAEKHGQHGDEQTQGMTPTRRRRTGKGQPRTGRRTTQEREPREKKRARNRERVEGGRKKKRSRQERARRRYSRPCKGAATSRCAQDFLDHVTRPDLQANPLGSSRHSKV
jgi:hypothetical protein